jgi:hypothetical protein
MSELPQFVRDNAARTATDGEAVPSQKAVGGTAAKVYLNDPAESTSMLQNTSVAEEGETLAVNFISFEQRRRAGLGNTGVCRASRHWSPDLCQRTLITAKRTTIAPEFGTPPPTA